MRSRTAVLQKAGVLARGSVEAPPLILCLRSPSGPCPGLATESLRDTQSCPRGYTHFPHEPGHSCLCLVFRGSACHVGEDWVAWGC